MWVFLGYAFAYRVFHGNLSISTTNNTVLPKSCNNLFRFLCRYRRLKKPGQWKLTFQNVNYFKLESKTDKAFVCQSVTQLFIHSVISQSVIVHSVSQSVSQPIGQFESLTQSLFGRSVSQTVGRHTSIDLYNNCFGQSVNRSASHQGSLKASQLVLSRSVSQSVSLSVNLSVRQSVSKSVDTSVVPVNQSID